MNYLYRGSDVIGTVADDGTVFAQSRQGNEIIGHVRPEGTILSSEGDVAGSVRANGDIIDATGAVVGMFRANGQVFADGHKIGRVQGDNIPLAAGALSLLIEPPSSGVQSHSISRSQGPSEPWGMTEWIMALVAVSVGLMALMFAAVVAVFTSFIWGVMAILSTLSAMAIADTLARSLPLDQVQALETVEHTTKRGTTEKIDPACLRPLSRFFPHFVLILSPALIYGAIVITIFTSVATAESGNSTLMLLSSAGAGGVILSVLAARKALAGSLNKALLQRLTKGEQTGPPSFGNGANWEKIAGYAGGATLVTLLMCIVIVNVKLQSNVPRSVPDSGTQREPVQMAVPRTDYSRTTASQQTSVPSGDQEGTWSHASFADQRYTLDARTGWAKQIKHYADDGTSGRTRVRFDIAPTVFIGIDRSDGPAHYTNLVQWKAHSPGGSIWQPEMQSFQRRFGDAFQSLGTEDSQLGGEPSVQWCFTTQAAGSAKERHLVIRAIHNGRLYAILCSSPDVTYARYEPDFLNVLGSFRFTAAGTSPAALPQYALTSANRVKPFTDKSWVIAIHSQGRKSDAVNDTKRFKAAGLPTGVLWIPDYGSMSGARKWLAYVGPVPYADRTTAHTYLVAVRRRDREAYALKADNRGPREELKE